MRSYKCLHARVGAARQRGAVLLLALVLLIILTLLGLSGMETALLEEQMAGNARNKQLSFNAAESALREGEDFLLNGAGSQRPLVVSSRPASGENQVWAAEGPSPAGTSDRFWWNAADAQWWRENAVAVNFNPSGAGSAERLVAENPRYVVEELYSQESGGSLVGGYEAAPRRYFYRITARGVGKNPVAETYLQSTFVRMFENE